MSVDTRSRILVWLDPNARQEASLEVLPALGSATEILGLFVEDISLIEVSRLGVAREITFEGTVARQIDERNIEQQFRIHGARMRKLFETAAGKISASHTFQVSRGELRSELLSVSTNFDIMVLAHSRRYFGSRMSVSPHLADLLVSGPRTLVFVQEQWLTGQRIVALFECRETGDAALRIAAAIARSEGLSLVVWLPDVPESRRRELEVQVAESVGGSTNYFFRTLPLNNLDELVRTADAENARVLVLPGTESDETQKLVAELLDRVSCSLIVAR